MFRSPNSVDKLLEKATSHLLLEPDWPTILQICDLIRQGDCPPKQALASINKKLSNDNPHVSLYALLVLESIVKNCGSPVHEEIGSRQYMEQLRELLKSSPHENVRNKILELLQAWAFAFRNSPKYRAVPDIVTILKAEGYKFPPQKESDAMFLADTAPEWTDGTVCHRCRSQFTMIQRKHHCRACGQVFCSQCSSKSATLPKFGIEKEVRVCEACYDQINNRSTPASSIKIESDLPAEYLNSSLAHQSQTAPRRTEDDLREEEELQLALALSQSEAEEKEKKKSKPQHMALSSHLSSVKTEPLPHIDSDPELARYLDRSYWDQRHKEDSNKVPSAPSHSANMTPATVSSQVSTSTNIVTTTVSNINSNVSESINKFQQNGVTEDNEIDDFLSNLRGQVEIFVNRMKSNSSRGRSIVNDSSVQALFMNITAMHSQLLRYIQQQDDNRVYYEGLQDKLTQVKDARAALDALRFEHREKLRQRAEEAERLRQMQMAQKLDIMRQKKQEYLQYQRQLALQRIQEQEREMQMRQEQQKQQYLMGGSFNRFMPPGSMPHGNVPPGALPPGTMPPMSMSSYPGAMYPQPGNPPYLSHQPSFGGHILQGVMPGNVMGSMSSQGHMSSSNAQGGPGGPQPSHMGSNPQGHMGPGSLQQVQLGPGTPQANQIGPGGPQLSQIRPGGPQPNQIGPGGPQPSQMGPGGPHPGQMGPGGPQPGQIGPGGPQHNQMGPGGPQPGHMGPGGPQHGQMGLGGGQLGHMGPNMSQQGPVGQIPHPGAMVMNGQAPHIGMPGSMVHMGAIAMHQAPVGGGMMGGQEVKKDSDELISFD